MSPRFVWMVLCSAAFLAMAGALPRAVPVCDAPPAAFAYGDATNDCGSALAAVAPGAFLSAGGTEADQRGDRRVVVNPDNPRWLFRRDGRPLFLCGPAGPENFLYRGKRQPDGTRAGDQLAIIRNVAASGANCLHAQAIRSHGGDGDRTHNPFIDNDPSRGVSEQVLDQWGEWFAEADRSGIAIFLSLYGGGACIGDTGDEVGEAERAFVRALVKRFGQLDYLVWCIAEEYEKTLSAKRVSNLAREIRAAGDKDHPIAVHTLRGTEFREFADDPHVGLFTMQLEADSPEALRQLALRVWKDAAGKSALIVPGFSIDSGTTRRGAASRMNWAAAMAGACVMVPGLDAARSTRDELDECGRLVKFFEQTDFHRMRPQDDLAAGDAAWVLANPTPAGVDPEEHKASCIAYAAGGRGRVGIKGLPFANYEVLWLDCRSGRMVRWLAARPAADGTFERPEGIGSEAAVFIRLMDFGVI